jgi:hypothetical protein
MSSKMHITLSELKRQVDFGVRKGIILKLADYEKYGANSHKYGPYIYYRLKGD